MLRCRAISSNVRPSPSRVAHFPEYCCHRVIMTCAYRGSISISRALRLRRSQAIKVEPAPAQKSPQISPALLLFTRARSTSSTGFIVGCRRFAAGLFFLPQRGLRFVTVTRRRFARDVAIEDRLMLELIAAKAQAKVILAQINLAADLEAGGLQRVLKLALPG